MTWETITMDFVEGLPVSGPANCILVVVDKFTKYAHFIPLYHPYTPSSVAQTFMTHVYRLHGLPASIVSDRDPVFTSTFWQQLFKLIGTELKLSSSYLSQTDGQTERQPMLGNLSLMFRQCMSQEAERLATSS
jgi:hypothetical protein